jgi:hypothetical protein
MPVINKDIVIDATVEELFSYAIQPPNMLQIWPSLVELKNQKPTGNGGFSYRWLYKMSGMLFAGSGVCTDIEPNCWFTAKNQGSIPSVIT